ncbi:MAG: hypothetical protein AAF585_18270 [Verrucomicrobiota bacterium]
MDVQVFFARSLFIGAIPILFIIVNAIVVLRWYRPLLPLTIGLAIYVVICLIRFTPVVVPEMLDLYLFAIGIPAILAIAGSCWSFRLSKKQKDRVYGVAFSILGAIMIGGPLTLFIMLSWASI